MTRSDPLTRNHVALAVLRTIMQSDLREVLGRLDKPTLILQSQADPAVPRAVADYLHRHIAGSRLTLVAASGHLPHITAPDEVRAAIHAFLWGPGPGPTRP